MIKEIMKEFDENKISRREYAEKMFSMYEKLFDYQVLFDNKLVKEIKISKDGIVAEIEYNSKEIKMLMFKTDVAAVTNTMLSFGEYENEEMDMTLKILELLEPKSVIFDVGANLGWYSLNVAKNNPDFKILSFEPVKDTFNKLVENIKINEVENALLFNLGLNNIKGSIDFFYDITASGASSFANLREEKSTKTIKCNFETLDNIVSEMMIDRLDFIKCDVEGSELMVYKGGLDSIKRFKPVVFSEMLRKWSAKFDYHPNDIIELFADIGYQCYVIDDSRLKKFDIVTEDTIETNYFFLHNEKHKYIISKLS